MLIEKFDRIVAQITPDENGCMIYPDAKDKRRQIYVYIKGSNYETVSVSRLALSRHLGRPILPKLCACHTCDVPNCVNPDHLYEGTHADNMRDVRVRHRARNGSHTGVKKIAP